MSSISIIKKLAKRADENVIIVERLWKTVSEQLISEGLEEHDPRFNTYLLLRMKRRLKIFESSPILKRFKDFLIEKKETPPTE
jgi:hypothetical protein